MKLNLRSPLVVLILFYLATRLYNLGELPIFSDEALYLDWSRQIAQNPVVNWDISLTDGQPPLYFMVPAIFWIVSPTYALILARCLSVLTGLGTVIGLYNITLLLISTYKRISIPVTTITHTRLSTLQIKSLLASIPSLIYVCSPFALWYDRMYMRDSFIVLLGVWLLFWVLKPFTAKTAMYIGLLLGIGLLTKSISYLYVVCVVLSLYLWHWLSLEFPLQKKRFAKATGVLVLYTLILPGLLYFLSDKSEMIANKNSIFLLSASQWLQDPLQLVWDNSYQAVLWLEGYLSIPLLVAAAIGCLSWFRQYPRLTGTLLVWGIIPLLVEIPLATIFFPRYLLMIIIPFCLFAGYGMIRLYSHATRVVPQALVVVLLVSLLSPSVQRIQSILFTLTQADIPAIERWQYLEGWPSGYGIMHTIATLQQHLDSEAVVRTEPVTLPQSALRLFLNSEYPVEVSNLPLNTYTTTPPIPSLLPTYALYTNVTPPDDWPLQHISSYPRVNNQSWVRLYKVKEKEPSNQ